MGYFMVHLHVAQQIVKNNANIKDIGAFYKGSLAPDAIMFRQGCKRSDKSYTHFCVGDEGWAFYTNYKEWENSLDLNIKNYSDTINSDFLFGYYTHILTDIAYTSRFWTPVRLTEDMSHINDFQKDCAEIDTLLLEGLESRETIWTLLSNSVKYSMPGLFNESDLTILINEMITKMYNNRKSNPEYKFKVIKLSDMVDFIDTMVSRISDSQFLTKIS